MINGVLSLSGIGNYFAHVGGSSVALESSGVVAPNKAVINSRSASIFAEMKWRCNGRRGIGGGVSRGWPIKWPRSSQNICEMSKAQNQAILSICGSTCERWRAVRRSMKVAKLSSQQQRKPLYPNISRLIAKRGVFCRGVRGVAISMAFPQCKTQQSINICGMRALEMLNVW